MASRSTARKEAPAPLVVLERFLPYRLNVLASLTSNALRPRGWTSADAAGLPILPGLVRYEEVAAGHIDHAIRFTVSRSRRAYVYPARHFGSSRTSKALPPMGLRLRLRF